jgi:hypothetical protein
MKDLDFIEIGTCCWDTLIERATDETTGLSVEPLQFYLDMLPNKNNVEKLCAAVVPSEDYVDDSMNVYYVNNKLIETLNLGDWLKGCNSVGKPHDLHLNYYSDPSVWHFFNENGRLSELPTINLIEKGIVSTLKIKVYTYQKLIEEFSIGNVNTLKVDAEGLDCKIVSDILDYHKIDPSRYPKNINFEANSHTPIQEKEDIVQKLKNSGYQVYESSNEISAVYGN